MVVPILLLTAPAIAGSGRLVVGVDTASGVSPIEPTWSGRSASASAVLCAGLAGWWVTGGHEYAGSRGEVLRTSDDHRWGAAAQACPTSGGGTAASLGASYGRQWGGQLYVAALSTAGLSVFGKEAPARLETPSGDRGGYLAVAPYLEPSLVIGLALPPGLSVELGPYAYLAPPLFQAAEVAPVGSFVGHAGLKLTVLAGSASPQVPWRR